MIPLARGSSVPMSRQIYMSLRQAILDGTFRGGERLPSTRTTGAAAFGFAHHRDHGV